MPESISTQPDASDRADTAERGDTAVRAQQQTDCTAEPSGAASQRVRELPPPPKAFVGPQPRIRTDQSHPGGWRRWWNYVGRRLSSGCVVSFVLHLVLLLSLALLVQSVPAESTFSGLVSYANVPVPLIDGQGDRQLILPQPQPVLGGDLGMQQQVDVSRIDVPGDGWANPVDSRRAAAAETAQRPDWLLRTDAAVGGGLDGRGRDARPAMAREDGGTPASENAVERGLRWLAAHQRADGSWNFDHHKSLCRGQCGNPGSEASTTAATAMALLPFLGAGYTHTGGEHQEVVKRGLYYLAEQALITRHGHDFQHGSMYAQGLAAIALCEAYAMTGDSTLKPHAQGAIDFICYAQDLRGGGWRYTPGQPGDTTVTGWQLMGLKSGQMAGLRVPSPTIYLVRRFLDRVAADEGAQYGYLGPQPRNTTTAIGLLMRMYTGWRRGHPALYRGVRYLGQWGPSQTNLYYDYYATQVMRHWGGPEWQQWNVKMREHLVASQAAAGHESGSWHFKDPHGDKGGRLYSTAMAVMTLEVYYRYMPLYGRDAVDDGSF